MSKGNYQFYQPQANEEKINDLINNIHNQEEYIKQLLAQYKGPESEGEEAKNEPKGIVKNVVKKKKKKENYYSFRGLKQHSFEEDKGKNLISQTKLPSIQSIPAKQNKIKFSERKRNQSFNLNLKKEEVNQIYKRKSSRVHHIQPLRKKSSSYLENQQTNQFMNMEEENKGTIPNPIGATVPIVNNHKNESSDEEAQVPLNYYQREFKERFQKQCQEELNFLYFSKNNEMKEWNMQFINLVEKHDKELEELHHRDKMFKTFDENYFLADFFQGK